MKLKKILPWVVILIIILAIAILIVIKVTKEKQLIGGCAGVALEHVQECCDNWAIENDVTKIKCIGYWKVENNKCAWKCQPEGLLFCGDGICNNELENCSIDGCGIACSVEGGCTQKCGEDFCPIDCGWKAICGDGICEPFEKYPPSYGDKDYYCPEDCN